MRTSYSRATPKNGSACLTAKSSCITPQKRPLVEIGLIFAVAPQKRLPVLFVVDTGADHSLLGTLDVGKLGSVGIAPSQLAVGAPSVGVGGTMPTRFLAPVTFDFGAAAPPLTLPQLVATEPRLVLPPIPSLLGRDVLRHFALLVDEGRDAVLLFTRTEVDRLRWGDAPLP